MAPFIPFLAVPALAVILDLILGDPHGFPHPVRLLGYVLDKLEKFIRKKGLPLRLSGWVVLGLLFGGSWYFVHLLTHLSMLGLILAIYFGYAGLALGCLLKETRKVVATLGVDDIQQARQFLSGLVSRDTKDMDASDIRRSLAETLSENLNDGFVAPLFYLCLFGPAGLWAYKAVSTMDSMWGYRTERYLLLGQGGALADDVLAYVPARLTAGLMILAGMITGCSWRAAMHAFPADATRMESPNAGWPMAAAAWLCGASMGGPTVYHGKIKDKPRLGPPDRLWGDSELTKLMIICRRAGVLAAVVLIPAGALFRAAF